MESGQFYKPTDKKHPNYILYMNILYITPLGLFSAKDFDLKKHCPPPSNEHSYQVWYQLVL